MKKRIIIVLLIIIFIFLFIGAYYFNLGEIIFGGASTKNSAEQIKEQQQKEAKQSYDDQFPDTIYGVINIISDDRATIKSGEKEYLVEPSRSVLFYKDSGIQDGSSIKVQGKITGNIVVLGNIVLSSNITK